jgi:outer membrane protein assembly factor BamB
MSYTRVAARKPVFLLFFSLVLPALLPGAEARSNWPQWRGPDQHGSAARGSYPTRWDASNVLWKAALPGKGCSTPIVWSKRIFLTAPIDGQDAALAFDWDGKPLWRATLGEEKAGKRQNSSGCNSSPATDGRRVFVYFKSGTLAALDLEGKLEWQTNLVAGFGPENLFWDQGASPVVTRDSVIIARMHKGESWVAAFDKATGKLSWKVPRNYETPVEGDNSYTTPILLGPPEQQVLLVWGAEHLTAHSAADGRVLWSCGGFNPKQMGYWPTVATPVVVGDIAVVAHGRADRGQPRLHGVKLGGSGDVTATHRVWNREDAGTFVPTPAVYEGLVYTLRDRGEIDCLDPLTGKVVWQDAFPKNRASFFSSPTIAAGKLYAARDDGVVFVARIKDGFKILAENPMGEQIIASPVTVDNRLLIRGDRHLFCIAE